MDKVLKFGWTEQSTLENGDMARLMGKEHSSMRMEMSLMAILGQTKLMVQAYTNIRTVSVTMVSGQTMFSKASEQRPSLMVVSIRENSMGAKNTEEAFINGLMEQLIVETGAIIKLMVLALTTGLMVEDMKVNGGRINYITEEYIHGQMDANMKVNT